MNNTPVGFELFSLKSSFSCVRLRVSTHFFNYKKHLKFIFHERGAKKLSELLIRFPVHGRPQGQSDARVYSMVNRMLGSIQCSIGCSGIFDGQSDGRVYSMVSRMLGSIRWMVNRVLGSIR